MIQHLCHPSFFKKLNFFEVLKISVRMYLTAKPIFDYNYYHGGQHQDILASENFPKLKKLLFRGKKGEERDIFVTLYPWEKYDLCGCLARKQKERVHSFNARLKQEFCDKEDLFLHLTFSLICNQHWQVCAHLIYKIHVIRFMDSQMNFRERTSRSKG